MWSVFAELTMHYPAFRVNSELKSSESASDECGCVSTLICVHFKHLCLSVRLTAAVGCADATRIMNDAICTQVFVTAPLERTEFP